MYEVISLMLCTPYRIRTGAVQLERLVNLTTIRTERSLHGYRSRPNELRTRRTSNILADHIQLLRAIDGT